MLILANRNSPNFRSYLLESPVVTRDVTSRVRKEINSTDHGCIPSVQAHVSEPPHHTFHFEPSCDIMEDELVDDPGYANAPPPKVMKSEGLMKLLSHMKASNENKQATIDEVGLYEADTSRNGEINPLEFWRENERRYPKLSKMARKYLAVPATSAPSERLFSRTGNIDNKLRCSLLPENVNKLSFLSAIMTAENE